METGTALQRASSHWWGTSTKRSKQRGLRLHTNDGPWLGHVDFIQTSWAAVHQTTSTPLRCPRRLNETYEAHFTCQRGCRHKLRFTVVRRSKWVAAWDVQGFNSDWQSPNSESKRRCHSCSQGRPVLEEFLLGITWRTDLPLRWYSNSVLQIYKERNNEQFIMCGLVATIAI